MNRMIDLEMNLTKQDNIPQLPLRRLSGNRGGSSMYSTDEDTCVSSVTRDIGLVSYPSLVDFYQSPPLIAEEVMAREQPNPKTPSIPIDPKISPNLHQRKEMVEAFWRCLGERDPEASRKVCTEDFQIVFRGAQRKVKYILNLDELIAGSFAIFEALPDFHIMYRAIEESQHAPGVLVLQDFVAAGKHTGKALELGPLPPIPTSGKLVVLDECEQHSHHDPKTNKIRRMDEIAMGELTGIFGMHSALLS